jgi:hypothetical protein
MMLAPGEGQEQEWVLGQVLVVEYGHHKPKGCHQGRAKRHHFQSGIQGHPL